jgi:isopentenyl phosphate kinase
MLLKIWWSLIAKKNTNQEMDSNYLKKIFLFLSSYRDEPIILIHGTGNVGHGFVQKHWLSEENKHLLRKNLDEYFQKIDAIFPEFTRIKIEDVLASNYDITSNKKIICWWDITNSAKILSSDDAFSHFLYHQKAESAYMLTDIDGVVDINRKIIDDIDKKSFEHIHFWKKEWDVTGGMKHKIQKLFNDMSNGKKKVRIINGKNTNNFKNIIEKDTGIGTKIYI